LLNNSVNQELAMRSGPRACRALLVPVCVRGIAAMAVVLCVTLFSASAVLADVWAAPLFADNMVLQRDQKVPVWGKAKPGDAIEVTFGSSSAKATAGADGKWSVSLPPMPADATGKELVIAGPEKKLTLKNVVVGEVWLCSGQSNMVWQVRQSSGAAEEIPKANDPLLRMFTVEYASGMDGNYKISPRIEDKLYALRPQEKALGSWRLTTPQNVVNFSGVGYYFGKQLRQKLDVPVGLIISAQGATAIEAWTSLEGLKAIPAYRHRAESFERVTKAYLADPTKLPEVLAAEETRVKQAAEQWYKSLDAADPGLLGKWMNPVKSGEADPLAKGTLVTLPVTVEDNPIGSPVATIWFRYETQIPKEWVGKELELSLGVIDGADLTFVNGTSVGKNWFDDGKYWEAKRLYTVPAAIVTDTRVTVVMRLGKLNNAMAPRGPADKMTLKPTGADESVAPVSLAGKWTMLKAMNLEAGARPQAFELGKLAPGNHYGQPGVQYNGMIAPIQPYAIRGAIWYQGEANAPFYIDYRSLLPGLIASWRKEWGQGDFPFGIVQLADYWGQQTVPVETNVGYHCVRESQAMTFATVPNTFLATAVGVGEGDNIHPKNKPEVGRRLALGALGLTYNQREKAWLGPVYQSMKIEGDKIRLTFDHAKGLHAVGEPAVGFVIAGADRAYYFAKAKIEGDQVVVWSEKVPNPVAVRYAWATNPVCNVHNESNLPIFQFKTDDWDRSQIVPTKDTVTIPSGWVPKMDKK
jgi:sialate O-acetylesterase